MADNTQLELSEDQKKAIALLKGENPEASTAIIAKEKGADDSAENKKEETVIEPVKVVAPELNDDMIVEYLKGKGIAVNALGDLTPKPTPEDEAKKLEEKESAKLTFGLKKGLFNRKEYESYVSDRKDRINLVFRAELEDAKAADAEWDETKEADFKAEFEEEFGLSSDPSSVKYKRGQKKLAVLSETLLKDTYGSIYSLDNEYNKYESSENTKKATEQKIIAAAPVYKNDVTAIVDAMSKVSIPIFGTSYEVAVKPEILKGIKDLMLDNDFSVSQILNGYTKETASEIANTLLFSKNFNYLMEEAAKQYRLAHEKGVRGIPPAGRLEKEVEGEAGLTDRQKESLEFFKNKVTPTTAN